MNYDVVEVVVDKFIRMFKLREWTYDIEELVEDIAEALKFIGAAKIYAEKAAVLTVTGKTARIPKDCQHIKGLSPECPYRESGSFIEIDLPDNSEVTILYQAMPLDTRGYVLVPDAVEVREAICWYLAKLLILRGELKTITFPQAEQEWQWRCGSGRAALNTWSPEQAFRIYQEHTRLNPTKDAHVTNYESLGRPNTLDREKHLSDFNRH